MTTISSTIRIMDAFSGPLNKLNAGLNKSQSAFSRFKGAMNGGAFDGLNKSAGKTGGMFKSMVGGMVIGNGITAGISAVGAGVKSMISELNESSKAWQTFDGNMNMLGKSPKQIAKAKSSMQQFAQKTIYSASDMASTYSQLAAVGIKGTGKLVKGFGGLAAASDNPQQAMKTLSQQATQMAAKPMVQWQDFKLMLEQTPAGISAVAKTMGMSTKDLVKGVQDGKVATQDFFDAISKTGTNKNFSKMATQYKTIGQAVDGLRETMANKMQGAFDRVGKVGIKFVSDFTNNLSKVDFDSLVDKAMGVASKIGQVFSDVFKGFKATGAIDTIKSSFGDIGKSIGDAFGKISGGKNNIFTKIGALSGSTLSGAVKGITALVKVISRLQPGTITALASAFVILKGGIKGIVFTAIINGLSKLKPSTITKIAGSIKNLAIAFVLLKAALKIKDGISKFGGALKKIKSPKTPKTPKTPNVPDMPQTQKPGGILQSAGAYMKLGASLMMVGAGVALAGGGMLMMAMATQKIVSGGAATIAVFFGMFIALGLLMGLVKLLGPEFIAGASGFLIFGAALLLIGAAIFVASAGLALLGSQLPNIAQYGLVAAVNLLALAGAIAVFGLAAIVGAVGLVLLGVALAVVGVGFLVGAIGALLFGVALAIIGVGAMVAAVGMLLLGVALAMVAVFTMVAAVGMLMMAVALVMISAVVLIAAVGMMLFAVALVMAAPLMMMAAVGALLLGAATIVLGVGLLIVGAALMVVAAGLMMVSAAVITLATAFIMAGTMMVSAITSAMTGVVSAVSNGIRSAVNAAKGFGSALVSVGKQLIKGLVNGIKSMIGSAVSAVKSVASKVVNAAKSALKIGSPSKLFKQYGRWVDQGLIIGLNRDANGAANASANMAQGVVDAASNMTPTLNPLTMGLSSNPGDLLANGFNRALDSVNAVSGAISGIASNTSIGVNGNISNSDPTDSPFDGPGGSFGTYGSNGTSTSKNSSVVIENGAIQINSTGNADYDAETLVSKIENYLMRVNDKSL